VTAWAISQYKTVPTDILGWKASISMLDVFAGVDANTWLGFTGADGCISFDVYRLRSGVRTRIGGRQAASWSAWGWPPLTLISTIGGGFWHDGPMNSSLTVNWRACVWRYGARVCTSRPNGVLERFDQVQLRVTYYLHSGSGGSAWTNARLSVDTLKGTLTSL
jgi:hypothetical protein